MISTKNIRMVLSNGLILLVCTLGHAQLSSQGYSSGFSGGVSSGESYTMEISTNPYGGVPKSENYGAYLGFASFNLPSAVISINTRSGGNTINDAIEGTLLRIKASGNYDTLDVVSNNNGEFSFNPVFLGSYLVNVDSDPDKYVATYFGDAILWDEADVLELKGDTAERVRITLVPPPRDETTGDGLVQGTIEEDFEDEEGRIDARRRAAKRKCGLRKRRRGGRVGQEDEFELIAYGETNENGEFEYGFLPEGTYRFFVEYPGIPLDESSFVEFDVGPAGVGDNEFVLAAIVTENGITVELILGITSEFFTDFSIYPNPTTELLNVKYDKILSNKMNVNLIDMNGKTLMNREVLKGVDGSLQIDLRSYPSGQYILKFIDTEKDQVALTFRVIKQ